MKRLKLQSMYTKEDTEFIKEVNNTLNIEEQKQNTKTSILPDAEELKKYREDTIKRIEQYKNKNQDKAKGLELKI